MLIYFLLLVNFNYPANSSIVVSKKRIIEKSLIDFNKFSTNNGLFLRTCEFPQRPPNFSYPQNQQMENLCNSFTYENFCLIAKKNCSRETGDETCFIRPDIKLSQVSQVLESRKIIAIEIFNKLKNSPEIVNICCSNAGSKESCETTFNKTELEISDNPNNFRKSEPELQKAFWGSPIYGLNSHKIYLPKEVLLHSGNVHILEATLLHELGHACQHSWIKMNNLIPADQSPYSYYSSVAAESIGDAHGLVAFSNDVRKCLDDKIKSKNPQPPLRLPSYWRFEGFALAIFASNMPSLYTWGFYCTRPADRTHPGPEDYIPCLIEHDPKFKGKYCPKE